MAHNSNKSAVICLKDYWHVQHSIRDRKLNDQSSHFYSLLSIFYSHLVTDTSALSSWFQPWWRPVKAWACHRWPLRMQNSLGPKHLHLFPSHDFPLYMQGKNWPLKSISSSIRFFCSGGWWDEPTMSVWSGILMRCRVACFSLQRMCWENLCSPAAPSPQHCKINWMTILVIS